MHSKAIKVIHCFRSPVGGLFRHVRDLINEQVKQGLQIGIICDSTTGGSQAEEVLTKLKGSCSLGIHRLAMTRSLSLSDIKVFDALSTIYKKAQPDIIHSHGGKGGAYGRLLARRFDAKTIYTPHGGSLHYSFKTPAGIIYLMLEKVLKSKTDGLLFESQYSADTYEEKVGQIAGVTQVIHNGLQESEFIPLDNSKASVDFVFIGELRKLKGVEVLLCAISQLNQRQKVSLYIYGAGSDEALFKSQVNTMNIGDAVTFLPPIFPSTQAFAQARCIVVPSLAESFPYIVLEATAAKVPLLTTRVGGIHEIFGPYADQLIAADDVAALSQSMQAFIDDPEQAKQRAELLGQHVHSMFRVEDMASQILAFYQDVLEKIEYE